MLAQRHTPDLIIAMLNRLVTHSHGFDLAMAALARSMAMCRTIKRPLNPIRQSTQ